MTDRIGAPGTGISRREFLIASGTGGAAALAGCVGSAPNPQLGAKPANLQQKNETLPLTAPPQVVQVNEQGGEVTLKSRPCRHAVHPIDSMGGPIEFAQVWAFGADDRSPSVPGSILRTTEGNDMEVTLDNTEGLRPHTVHFHGSLQALVADDPPQRAVDDPFSTEPHACEPAHHDDEERSQQNVHVPLLVVRLVTGKQPREEQASAEPQRRDPENAEIEVIGLRQRERKPLEHVDSERLPDPEEAVALDVIVS